MAAYEIALSYAKQGIQFGKCLASFQIIQNKLAVMLANLTSMQLLCLRLAQLQAEGKLTEARASLAKMSNARLAREVVADASETLSGNGILMCRRAACAAARALPIRIGAHRRCAANSKLLLQLVTVSGFLG
jgi:alkylation response protein AidB-like acyl-CoA dehydrogenase